jgi:ABC-2 type transport system permease protein
MRSRTSFINKGIFKNELKRFSWIGVLYTIALFFIMPLQILMIYSREEENFMPIKAMINFSSNEIQGIFILTVPVILGLFLFRYMQVKSSSDITHSLPVKRETLYVSHVIIGILMIVLPVVLTGMVTQLLNTSIGLGEFYNINDILKWCGFTILLEITIFFTCVAVGMLVGNSILQGVLTYIFLFLPLGLTLLITYNLSYFLYGYAVNIDKDLEKLSPIVRVLQNTDGKISGFEVTVYIIICVILFVISMLLYKKRKLEAAGQTISFPRFNRLFTYGVSFCTMLLVGSYFYETQNSLYWGAFGYFIGSLFGYFIAEMVVKKSIWVFNNIKGYAIFATIAVLLVLGVRLDITGYEKRIPEFNNVKTIYMSESGFYGLNDTRQYDIYSDRKNLELIYELHRSIIKDKSKNQLKKQNNNEPMNRNMTFVYELENGDKISRLYKISIEDYKKYFKPIYESIEYKKMRNGVFSVNAADAEKITINPNMKDKQAVILKPEDIKEAIEILQKEVKNESFEQMFDQKPQWAGINIMIADDKVKKYPNLLDNSGKRIDNQVYVSWEKSFNNFEEWLKRKGYYENSRVLPEDIDYVVVEKIESAKQLEERFNTQIDLKDKSVIRMEITDKKQIETILNDHNNLWNDSKVKYIVGFYSKNGDMRGYGSFRGENVPDFVKSYFNK